MVSMKRLSLERSTKRTRENQIMPVKAVLLVISSQGAMSPKRRRNKELKRDDVDCWKLRKGISLY